MDLPAKFKPFNKLEIGSNVFIHGKVPIAFRNFPILLVGNGAGPRIWLSVPEKDQGVRYLVEDNEARSRGIGVLQKDDAASVYFNAMLIIQTFKKSEDEAKVTHLDLTPLGLTIRADLNSPTVGGNVLSSDTFEGVEIMVNVA